MTQQLLCLRVLIEGFKAISYPKRHRELLAYHSRKERQWQACSFFPHSLLLLLIHLGSIHSLLHSSRYRNSLFLCSFPSPPPPVSIKRENIFFRPTLITTSLLSRHWGSFSHHYTIRDYPSLIPSSIATGLSTSPSFLDHAAISTRKTY